jgi:hypothetical protein
LCRFFTLFPGEQGAEFLEFAVEFIAVSVIEEAFVARMGAEYLARMLDRTKILFGTRCRYADRATLHAMHFRRK